jgi:hypothetical protein
VQNFLKQNNIIANNSSSQAESDELDFMQKKLFKKKTEIKQKSNYLNFTNPHNNNKQIKTNIHTESSNIIFFIIFKN